MKDRRKGGMGVVSVLTLIFIVMKLSGTIDWSWIWVLCPVWVSVLFIVIVFAVIMVGGKIKKGKW